MDLEDFAHQCVFSLKQFYMNHLPSSLISPNMNLEFNHLQSTQSLSLFEYVHFFSLIQYALQSSSLSCLVTFSLPWLLQLGVSLIFPCMVIPSSFSFMDCPQLRVSLLFSLWLFFISFHDALTFAQATLSGFQPSVPFFFFFSLSLSLLIFNFFTFHNKGQAFQNLQG